jgi:hypothetical protein
MRPELKRPLSLEKGAALVTIVGFPLLLVSLIFAAHHISELKQVARSQNNIALSTMFSHDPTNLGIIEAIENKKPILNTVGGSFSSTQLDKYLGDLETVYDVYEEGLLSEKELCGSFSVYAQEAEGNADVQEYLKKNSDYFDGLPKLFNVVDHSKAQGCRD